MPQITIPWKTHYFYRNRLNPADSAIYETIFDGLMNWKSQIILKKQYDIEHVYSIYTMVLRDCPMLFHVSTGISMHKFPVAIVVPNYIMTPEQYERASRKVQEFALRSVDKMKHLDPYHRAKNIHDSMLKHVIYGDLDAEHSHNAIGAILKKLAVCESISKAYKLLCDVNQIPCIVIFGYGSSADGVNWGDVASDDHEDNHAWNCIKVGGRWYNVDVTYDLGISNYPKDQAFRYDYFCRSDAVFRADHRPSGAMLPKCEKDHSVYRSLQHYVTSNADLVTLVRKLAPKGTKSIVFEYEPSPHLSPDTMVRLLAFILIDRGLLPCSYSTNPAMHIMQVYFQ